MGFFINKGSKFTENTLFSDKRQCTVAAQRLLAVAAAASLASRSERKGGKIGNLGFLKSSRNRSSQSFAIGFSMILRLQEYVLYNDICH